MADVRDKIPSMRIRDTVELWRNAIRSLNDPKKSWQHDLAQKVLVAIRDDWQRRRRMPANPDEIFAWPSTEASAGTGGIDSEDWIREGALKFLGYKVGGIDGEPQGIRERILREVFFGEIPPVFPRPYLDEWGDPSSVQRLQKMAETIAALVRNAKRRRDSRMAAAIRDWENDLEYLYYEFYVGKFYFAWPSAAI